MSFYILRHFILQLPTKKEGFITKKCAFPGKKGAINGFSYL